MPGPSGLTEFGFSQYEAAGYMTLLGHHPANGSQLSKRSGIARSRIYDVLRALIKKGLVFEIEAGQYVPLPPDELLKQLQGRFSANLANLEAELAANVVETEYEYILTLRGVAAVMQKAAEIIDNAGSELYVRLFPQAEIELAENLRRADERGVGIRHIAMGETALRLDIQIRHPAGEDLPGRPNLIDKIGGESIDILADKSEALVGIFVNGEQEQSRIMWTRNAGFVVTNRDSLRHDFYHYFLDKLYDRGQPLSEREKRIYRFIKADD